VIEPELVRAAERLLRAAGLEAGADPVSWHRLPGGANNRVFRIDPDGGGAVLKAYFRHPADPRDRLGAEYGFVTYARAAGIRAVPAPLGVDAAAGVALYELAPGRPAEPRDVTGETVDRAADFVVALNDERWRAAAGRLPAASEACFSIADHAATVERRVARLAALEPDGPVERDAARFVAESLVPAWRQLSAEVVRKAAALRDETLPPECRCVSPSDFGFHNALVDQRRGLTFVDFEYAGWDDPAKLVCDFFCQPRIPVGTEHLDRFSGRVLAGLRAGEEDATRIRLLMPVYRLKWTCILLNDFIPADRRRRAFALGDDSLEERLKRQLARARAALDAIPV
jgi:hypothetical protein